MNRDDIVKYSATERLRDLRPVTIRTVRPDDKGLVIEALPGVSAESIQRRLFTSRKEITADDLKRITEVNFVNVAGLVALLKKEGHYHIVGRGRYIRSGASVNGQRAEVAFLVADAFQGLVIASLILRLLVTIARRSGIIEFEAEVLPTNEAMQKVFTRSGMPVTRTVTRDTIHFLIDFNGIRRRYRQNSIRKKRTEFLPQMHTDTSNERHTQIGSAVSSIVIHRRYCPHPSGPRVRPGASEVSCTEAKPLKLDRLCRSITQAVKKQIIRGYHGTYPFLSATKVLSSIANGERITVDREKDR